MRTCFSTGVLRRAATILILAAAFALPGLTARADDYPSRPVRIIVPFGAGGPTDVFVRAIAIELQKSLHQSFVVENRPGAGTTIGTDYVARSAPDGYTLLMVSSTQTVNETLYKNRMTLNDISDGQNDVYHAAQGWDPITGLGTTKAQAIIKLF